MNAVTLLKWEDYARANLLAYSSVLMPTYQPDLMHRSIADALDMVESGQVRRLVIEAPPQHGKTLEVSQFFPAWYLGRHPESSIIYTTYGADRAQDVGRAVRDNLRSPEHLRIFGQRLSNDSASVVRFSALNDKGKRGHFFAVGRGGALTGRGANGIIIDDPIKNRAEADSQTIRRQLEAWYSSVLYTRLRKNGWIILVMTRWQLDDLAGYLLTKYAHDGWTRLRMPALAEERDPLGRKPGEALAPERYDIEALNRIKMAILGRDWNALYQQRPTETAGDIYLREWFDPRYETIRDRVRYYGFSDYAVSEGGGDSTEHGIFAIDPDFNAYAVDWYSGKVRSDVWVEKMIDMAAQWRVAGWFEEGGVISKAVRPLIIRRQRERHQFFRIESLSSITDKVTRSTPAVGRAAHKRILFPFSPWANEVIDELVAFHEGATQDNKADVVSLLGRALDKMAAPAHARDIEPEMNPFTIKWLMQEKSHGKPRRF